MKYTEPILFLYPLKEEISKITKYFELEIKGYMEYVGGEKSGEIYIPKGYRIKSRCTAFASTWDECIVEIDPDEIYQKRYIKKLDENLKEKTNLVFSLTENGLVSPLGWFEMSFNGSIKSDIKPRVILNFGDGWIAKFERHYRYIDKDIEEVDGTFLSSRLVLNIEKNSYLFKSLDEIIQLSNSLDTLLWYLSFGSRQRTTWLEWTAKIGAEYIEYYRNYVSHKTQKYIEPLIDEISIQEFLQHCLNYETQRNRLDISLPITYLVSASDDKTIEMKFLSLFMALEALLDLYAESKIKNKIIKDKSSWDDFYSYMTKAIEDFPNLDDKEQMIKKLGIFNQPSRKVLYDDFCKNIEVDNSDLWPVFGNKLDLSRIRNKLIHGKRFESWSVLTIAKEHLRWTVERCLLAVLGWKDTGVFHKESLQKYTAYRDWKDYYEKTCSL
jgi:hypothetical protein